MHKSIWKYLPTIIILISSVSCDAPRNNPLDPNNPDNSIGIIEGTILTVKVPQRPIPNAKIYWANSEIITSSDVNGFFSINGIERKDGLLTIEHQDYSTDSVFIRFGSKNKFSDNFFLNSFPKIVEFNFFSVTLNTFKLPPQNQNYNLGVKVKITDEENDIDSVFIENIELNSKVNLLYNATTKYYENSLKLSDLNLTLSIDAVIGKNFFINVFDANKEKFTVGQSNIKRIIKQEILTNRPSGRDTVYSGNPTFEWEKFEPGFNFNYKVEIYTNELSPSLVWEKGINSEAVELQTSANLTSGDYYWVIWAIDEFENQTRSKPASFVVK